MQHSIDEGRHAPPVTRRYLAWVIPVSVALIVLIGAGAWIGIRGLAAKHALENAQSLIVDLALRGDSLVLRRHRLKTN